jgi:hypothetical protein
MNNLKKLIDDFGVLKAQIAELETQEKAMKAMLNELGPGAYEGELFRLTISDAERDTRDKAFKAKIEELVEEHTSVQYRTAHTSTNVVRSFRSTARNGKVLVAA